VSDRERRRASAWWVTAIAVTTVTIAGLAYAHHRITRTTRAADLAWRELGGHGPMPEHDARAIRNTIVSISAHASRLASMPGTAKDWRAFHQAYLALQFAEFTDDRQHYMVPIRDALKQVRTDSAKGRWTDVTADVADVAELGSEYLARF